MSRLLAAQNQAHGDELKKLEESLSGATGPRDRAGERECEI